MIEPGLVRTSFGANLKTNSTGHFDLKNLDVDEETQKVYQDSFGKFVKQMVCKCMVTLSEPSAVAKV